MEPTGRRPSCGSAKALPVLVAVAPGPDMESLDLRPGAHLVCRWRARRAGTRGAGSRDLGSLNRLVPEPAGERLQLRDDLEAALAHLREVRDKYWDHAWRHKHRGYGRYPENELWEAVEGYLDLVDASQSGKPDT